MDVEELEEEVHKGRIDIHRLPELIVKTQRDLQQAKQVLRGLTCRLRSWS